MFSTHHGMIASSFPDQRTVWPAATMPEWDSLVFCLCKLAMLLFVQLWSPGAYYQRCVCQATANQCQRYEDICAVCRSHCSVVERSRSYFPSAHAANIPVGKPDVGVYQARNYLCAVHKAPNYQAYQATNHKKGFKGNSIRQLNSFRKNKYIHWTM